MRYTFILSVLSILSVTAQLAANLVSSRLGFFGPYIAPMGVFFFPFVYIISDVISDVYGYGVSRRVAWMTILMQVLFIGTILAVITIIAPAPFALELDAALRLLFVGSAGLTGMVRVALSGIAGAVLGGWCNDIIFQLFRHIDGTDKFLRRKLLSSLGAELVDTVSFITLAFAFTPAWSLSMYVVQFVLKYGVEVLTSPVAKKVSSIVRSVEGPEVFEDRNNFNIFGWRITK